MSAKPWDRISRVEALELLLETERALARVNDESPPDEGWRQARSVLRTLRTRLYSHVRASISRVRR